MDPKDPERKPDAAAPDRELIDAARRQANAQAPGGAAKGPTLSEFAKSVLRSRLVPKTELEQHVARFNRRVPRDRRSASQFARFLIEHSVLTRYQAERLMAGRTEGFFLGGCKILDRLGAGGMGKVYLAEQTKLGRQVALKVLPSQYAKDPDYLARFRREARAAAGLKHPNIVQVYDVGDEKGVHFIIMELARGANLNDRIKRTGPMPVDESIDVIRQVALGLQHANEHGIVHRDIKPSNLVVEGQTAKILDLGLARQFGSGEPITQQDNALGTPDYMSPEQVRDARSADVRSDLYSLGCTWYTLLSGQPPFPAGDAVGKALAHVEQTAKSRPSSPN